jgi:choline-sulfatase
MNVIFIYVDQHNPVFSGCYGGLTRTPNIDKLSRQGLRFQNAYSTCPLCVPARASMWTGRYVHEIGNWDNAMPYDGKIPNWGHYLNDNGVYVTTVGKLDFKPNCTYGITEQISPVHRESLDVLSLFRDTSLPPRKKMHIYNHWSPEIRSSNYPLKQELDITEKSINWLRNCRPADRPWLLNINYLKPHPKWHVLSQPYDFYKNKIQSLPSKYLQAFDELNPVEQAQSIHTCGFAQNDNKIIDSHVAYHSAVEEVDMHVGKILDCLDDLEMLNEVLVIYSADHGEMARAHGIWGKSTLYEDSVRIPFIMSGPGVPKAQVVEKPVTLLNIFPTIASAFSLDNAFFSKADSLIDFNDSINQESLPEYVFSESHANGRITGSYIIRKDDWKLFWYVGYESMLFNLKDDPNELNNLLETKPEDKIVQRKFIELRKLLYKTCSPEGVDLKARKDQLSLREELAETNQLYDELEKRGFKRNENKLEPSEEFR